MVNYHLAREDMVEDLERKGIRDRLVLAAIRETRRHQFVPSNLRGRAYEDTPLSIGAEQTISQPYMVAKMTELLKLEGEEKVLELGTGSGYQTAVLSLLCDKIFTIERISSLAKTAKETFERLEIANVVQKVGDGSVGWSAFAPFDRIIVTAGAPEIPKRLLDQLADGGRMVIPTGPRRIQDLKLVEKDGDKITVTTAGGCVFVPLIGSDGWKD
jgi:protein-L-isoaspartate(D-aspartate) O-methyltransferase